MSPQPPRADLLGFSRLLTAECPQSSSGWVSRRMTGGPSEIAAVKHGDAGSLPRSDSRADETNKLSWRCCHQEETLFYVPCHDEAAPPTGRCQLAFWAPDPPGVAEASSTSTWKRYESPSVSPLLVPPRPQNSGNFGNSGFSDEAHSGELLVIQG